MSSSHPPDQRRRFLRVDVRIRVRVQVLIPEDTFNPPPVDGLVCDLNERGAMVLVDMQEDQLNLLFKGLRYCRIIFPPGDNLPERMVGRAVWIQPESFAGTMRSVRVGLSFEEGPAASFEILRAYVASIAQVSGHKS